MRSDNRTSMRAAATDPSVKEPLQPEPIRPHDGVLVLSGFGLRIAVERGHLVVNDGIGETRRSGRLHRATCGLTRLVVLGHSGTISLEALRWLHDIGAAFIQLDADGEVVVASGPRGLDDARLRRAQALASTNGVGIAIARDLLRSKLEGQAAVLRRLPESKNAIALIEDAMAKLPDAGTPAQLRAIEAQAASGYWSGWSPVSIRFAKRDQPKVPEHWHTFGTRASAVSGVSRNASTPINALLNYLYAILETDVRLAIITMGLDPGMAILHSDLPHRDSFVYDVIEPLRPVVDDALMSLLEERTFAATEFFETRQGVVRLMPPLPQVLAEMSPRLAKLAAPVVEQVAQCLTHGQGATKPFTVPTLLTQSNRGAARGRVRTSIPHAKSPWKLEAPAACRECGVILRDRSRQYCEGCLPAYRKAQAASFSTAGRAKLQELRASGTDPSQIGQAAEKRRSVMKQRRQEELTWDAAHNNMKVDETVFTKEILPILQGLSLAQISAVTGLSQQYCSLIRRGLKVPHPRHWKALSRVGDESS